MTRPDKRKPSFSIILVNYKSHEVTSICLGLIRKAVNPDETTVFVVDNDSKDESLEYLKSLEWIRLIERKPGPRELGFMAHGKALDLAFQEVTSDYVFILHTDTFIYDAAILDTMLEKCRTSDDVAAVGCMEPTYRSLPHTVVRVATRGTKYYFRELKRALGIRTRRPKLYFETHMKSFCMLWNAKIIRQHGMTFSMGEKIPSYEMQDQLRQKGYQFIEIPPKVMFSHMDHIDKATASAMTGFRINQRRIGKYREIIARSKEMNR